MARKTTPTPIPTATTDKVIQPPASSLQGVLYEVGIGNWVGVEFLVPNLRTFRALENVLLCLAALVVNHSDVLEFLVGELHGPTLHGLSLSDPHALQVGHWHAVARCQMSEEGAMLGEPLGAPCPLADKGAVAQGFGHWILANGGSHGPHCTRGAKVQE